MTTLQVELALEDQTITVVAVLPTGPRGATGPAGAAGPAGAPGAQGPAGEGVPVGGTEGQALVKASATDFDTEWADAAGGGVQSVAAGTGIDVDATDPDNPIVSVEPGIATDAEVAAAVATEAATRAAADTALDGRVDTLELAPPAHAASHGDGGSDEIAITGEQVTGGTVAEPRIAAALARLASPTFTGTPVAPTAANGTNTTQLATTAFVQAAVALLLDSAPGALDTLNELAAALGDDPAFATTVTNALAGKQPLDSDLTAIAALTTVAYGRGLLELADAAALRSAAELVLGTNIYSKAAVDAGFQPLDADLTSIAALTTTSFGRSLLESANASALRTLAGLILGTDIYSKAAVDSGFQPLDADLTAIAALTTTSFGRSVLEAANAAALRTLAGTDAAYAPSAHKQIIRNGGGNITGLASTSFAAIDATNLGYQTLTLAVGDVVECFFQAQMYFATLTGTWAIDFEVDQPTSANVFVGAGGDAGLSVTFNGGARVTDHVTGRFVATEAGSHGFRPVYKLAAASPTLVVTNATSGFDETSIIVAVRNLGPVTA